MSDFLADEGYIRALIWTLAALALLIVVLFAVRMIRGFGSGTLIAGGRNRVPRLAVVDAAAVDNQRRLVLVRRDDVEHLILIGGPSDLVIEQQIRAPQTGMARPQPRVPAPQAQAPAARRPPAGRQEPVVAHPQATPPPRAAPHVAPEAPRSNPAPAAERPPQSAAAAAAASREPAQQQAPVAPQEEPRAAPAPSNSENPQPEHEQAHPRTRKEEAALLEDIDLSIDEIRTAPPSSDDSDESLDDEMSRLLNDLSNEKKS